MCQSAVPDWSHKNSYEFVCTVCQIWPRTQSVHTTKLIFHAFKKKMSPFIFHQKWPKQHRDIDICLFLVIKLSLVKYSKIIINFMYSIYYEPKGFLNIYASVKLFICKMFTFSMLSICYVRFSVYWIFEIEYPNS